MEVREALAIAGAIKNHFRAFAKLEEFVSQISEFITIMETHEAKIKALSEEVASLEASRSALKAEIVAMKDAAEYETLERANKVFTEYVAKAETESTAIREQAEAAVFELMEKKKIIVGELSFLSEEKSRLSEEVSSLSGRYSEEKAKLMSEIKALEDSKLAFEEEIGRIKGKISSL